MRVWRRSPSVPSSHHLLLLFFICGLRYRPHTLSNNNLDGFHKLVYASEWAPAPTAANAQQNNKRARGNLDEIARNSTRRRRRRHLGRPHGAGAGIGRAWRYRLPRVRMSRRADRVAGEPGAQQRSELGYSPSLHARLRMVLPTCIAKASASSAIWAPPIRSAARAPRARKPPIWASAMSPVAVVLGDDVSSIVKHRGELKLIENGEPLESILPKMISANAYLGADVVVRGAQHRRADRAVRPGGGSRRCFWRR